MYKEKCIELGYPEPRASETQVNYVVRIMLSGLKLHTRNARHIGIGNLHSIAAGLSRKKVEFSLSHVKAKCPETGEVPYHKVDQIWMTQEQRAEYLEKKKGSKQ
ncbi:hypothetical protein L4C34_05995 [Vibrio profundum]|uniref:hypothetical protein n=1 Tax=Vibrio profundum TaxID=2910247 RepID=UPI003D0D1FFC